ncbi:MAG: DUF1800 domain-containing protein [Sulfitobacter sp.]
MSFSPEIAERRFGYGLSPDLTPVASTQTMLNGVNGADDMALRFPIPGYRYLQDKMVSKRRFDQYARANPDTEEGKRAGEKARALNREVRLTRTRWFAQLELRRINSTQSFRERLVAFWGDHFTAVGKGGLLRPANSLYLEDAVRPNISGTFADLLIACVTHPLMLHYLDQNVSAGPNSIAAQRTDRRRGLNENLAREVLELHTLGAGGPYSQDDVRELAMLFTGMGGTRDMGFKFRRGMTEPGPETILGKTYGGAPSMEPIFAVLKDMAAHPATAAHIAQKLAVHFVSDTPPGDLVAQLRDAYLDSGGDLMVVYAALLDHPAAWQQPATNIKPPADFVSSALRALAVSEATFEKLREQDTRAYFYRPLGLMGQTWQRPDGPDGWSEKDRDWVTPQGIAARLEWAIQVPTLLIADLPDPRDFIQHALGQDVPGAVQFAAKSAETRAEAIGLVLASPAFQRR